MEGSSINAVSILLAVIIAGSAIAGLARGARGTANSLYRFAAEGLLTALSIVLAWKLAGWADPQAEAWLQAHDALLHNGNPSALRQTIATFLTMVRDFPLLRFGLLFLIGYLLVGWLLRLAWSLSFPGAVAPAPQSGRFSLLSSLAGGLMGAVIGAARALLAVAVLFIYVTLWPQAPFTQYIQASQLYQQGATQVVKPFAGDFVEKRLPVFTRAVEDQFSAILQRRYEVIDRNIPDNIAEAARTIVAGADTDESKARALYKWVGTRVSYDYEKVRLYEEDGVWKEQSPEDTFRTHKGVCIDYSRLYAVMARSVGLQVKVVTGLGYDGRGGYGPHAWNEVYLSERNEWVPLDTTWESSGGNWFDPAGFDRTHVKEA